VLVAPIARLLRLGCAQAAVNKEGKRPSELAKSEELRALLS
jgi:hypothetical protein